MDAAAVPAATYAINDCNRSGLGNLTLAAQAATASQRWRTIQDVWATGTNTGGAVTAAVLDPMSDLRYLEDDSPIRFEAELPTDLHLANDLTQEAVDQQQRQPTPLRSGALLSDGTSSARHHSDTLLMPLPRLDAPPEHFMPPSPLQDGAADDA